MATIIETIALGGVRKADGSPCAGGLVFLTAPGSASVAVVAYTDRNKSSAVTLQSGGYRLDAAGRAALFIEDPCTVRVEDSTGATVATFSAEVATNAGLVEVLTAGFTGTDPVSGAQVSGGRTYLDTVLSNLAGTFGGTDALVKGWGTTSGISLVNLLKVGGFTPQMFGAKGDGATDDLAAFNLMGASAATYSIPMLIPQATYRLSGVWAPPSPSVIRGSASANAVLEFANVTDNGISCGISFISNITVRHATASSGAGITGSNPYLQKVTVTAGDFTTGANATYGQAVGCSINGITNALTGEWVTDQTTFSGAVSASSGMFAQAAAGFAGADLANAGSVTPDLAGTSRLVAQYRIRATSTGAGTVNAATVPTRQKLLILDCYNNSGGAFTFTMNAQYKVASNPAPANGSRTALILFWENADSCFVELGRATTT